MKVRFNVNSGANIHSTKTSDWMDTVDDLGLNEEEWESLSEDEKWEYVNDWAQGFIEIYHEEQ